MSEMTRPKKLLLFGSCLLALATLVTYLLYSAFTDHHRHLDPAAGWTAEATTSDNQPLSTAVYEMRGRTHVLFIEVLGTPNDDNRWFAIDTERRVAVSANWPRRTPYLHYKEDQSLGVELRPGDVKLQSDWAVTWADKQVSFSSDSLTVLMKPTEG